MAVRLLVLKSDGSMMVHADSGGYKPQNWMTAPTVVDIEGEPPTRIEVRKLRGEERIGVDEHFGRTRRHVPERDRAVRIDLVRLDGDSGLLCGSAQRSGKSEKNKEAAHGSQCTARLVL